MKKRKNMGLLILLLFMIQNATSIQAQIRLGGSTAPNQNAILDLNTGDTVNGSKGLLLPRVALVSCAHASPLTEHVRGMCVYNTATANDVLPGMYYNDGTKWIRGEGNSEVAKSNVRQLEITIDETIDTRSMIYHGETTMVQSDLKVLSIEPVFSDDVMAQTFFTVSSSAKPNEAGTAINWSVKVINANISFSKSCKLQKIIITYMCNCELNTSRLTGKYVLVGQ
ncbi:MAG: hypothetical protein LBP96_03195 [Bacteroidales bacterium]|jgi:hypothetical protein|nr:hypothetical protein [Bacteroidales bacterium]